MDSNCNCELLHTYEDFGASPGVSGGTGSSVPTGIGGGVGANMGVVGSGQTEAPGAVAGAPSGDISGVDTSILEQQLVAAGLQRTPNTDTNDAIIFQYLSRDQGNNDSRGFLSEEVSTQAQGSVYGFKRTQTIVDPTVISKEVQAQLKSSSLGSSGSDFSDQMVDIQKGEDEDEEVLIESFTVKSNKKIRRLVLLFMILLAVFALTIKYIRC